MKATSSYLNRPLRTYEQACRDTGREERTRWGVILPVYLALFLLGALGGHALGYLVGTAEMHASIVERQAKLARCHKAIAPFMEPDVFCWRIK